MSDPYAAYGGSASSQADPYAAYGGTVAPPPAEKSLTDKLTEIQPHEAVHSASDLAKEVGRGVGNIGAGAMGVILHPVDTAAGVVNSVLHPIDTATTLVKNLKERPLETIESGVGQAAVLGAAGEAAPAVAGPAVDLARRGGGRAILLGHTPEGAYESALKPSTVLSPSERSSMVQTGMQNSIPVSKGGLQKLSNRIDALNQAIKDEIATDPTRPIDPNVVAPRADVAKAKFAKQVNAQGDLNAVEASKQQFLDEQGRKPGTPAQPTGLVDAQGNPIMRPAKPPTPAPPMNAEDAQAMKQGTYRVLSGKFGEQGSASVEAQKALARGLKEEIATQFPEISKLNATESRLLDLQPALERAVNRISNHQAVGIGTPVAGAAAKAVTGSGGIGAVASVLKGVLDNPNVKSRLAIMVSKANKIPISAANAKVQAYASSLGSIAGATQASPTDDNPSQPATPQP